MATPPDNHQAPLKYQTWTLKVPIHCEGCKKKVRKILQSMDGVYMTTIDSQQHKVTVTGNIEAETLLRKLSKSGKPAQLWPDYNKPKEIIQEPPPNMEEVKDKPKPNDEQVNQNHEKNQTDTTQPPTEGGNDQDGQSKKKKKKNKGKNSNSTDTDNVSSGEAPPPESTPPPPPLPEQVMPPPPPPESMDPPPPPPPEVAASAQRPPPIGPPMKDEIPIESLSLGPPNKPGPGPPPMHHQQAYHPYFRPSVNNPGYMHMPPLAHNPPPPPPPLGVSYSMAQPSSSGSYYVPPAYPYYAYPHHPMMHNIPLPPPPRRINEYYDDHDQYDHRDYHDDATNQCRLM